MYPDFVRNKVFDKLNHYIGCCQAHAHSINSGCCYTQCGAKAKKKGKHRVFLDKAFGKILKLVHILVLAFLLVIINAFESLISSCYSITESS